MQLLKKTAIILGLVVLASCGSKKKFVNTPALTASNDVHAVIEIPAGTNKKIEYNEAQAHFAIDKKEGKDRIIQYLPYIGNYGFIPSTIANPEEDGDGDPLDILVIAEHAKTGTIMDVKPIGLLKLVDQDKLDYKVIAVPVDATKNILHIHTYQELKSEYPSITSIIELWFKNYDKDKLTIVGWGDENEAIDYIKSNLKK
ncbi:inorganic diphosphatase [Zhouia sp. PK063]|uniref:inorganic diphosphatase n=1 Tax=Zhouia sp. PK063 TaxID=3373602 RepID=UPI0037976905